MARWLEEGGVVVFRIGPFVDDTDFKTAEIGLSIGQADIQISKAGGAYAQTSDSTPTTTHDKDGWYQCPLTAVDTNTLGPLTVQITVAGALPVWEHFMVVRTQVYDSYLSVDRLEVDVVQLSNVAQSLADLKDFADAGYDPGTNKVQGVVLCDTTTAVTNDVGITQAGADKVWGTAARTLTSFGTLITDIWHHLLSGITTASTIGKLIKDNLDQSLSTTESNIRGADSDDLKAISDEIAALNDFDPASDTVKLGNVAHGGAAATITLKQLVVTATGNDDAVAITGSGTGHGVLATGGNTTADGMHLIGGTGGDGLRAEGTGGGEGISSQGGVTGHGIHAAGGATSGNGLNCYGGVSGTGHGIAAIGSAGTGDGINVSVTSGDEIEADITGNLSGSVGSVAYSGPRGTGIYLDDAAANTNTVAGVDGIESNPVSTIAAATTIAGNLGIRRIYLVNDSSVTLAQTYENWEFVGIGLGNQIDLGSQDVDSSSFFFLILTGTQGGTSRLWSEDCYLTDLVAFECLAHRCFLTGNNTIRASSLIVFDRCKSAVAGNATPELTFAGGTTNVHFRAYSGGLQLNSMATGDTMSYEADGQIIVDASCTDGALTVRGNCDVTDNASGAVTITQSAAINQANINAECDTAISDAALATAANLATVDGVVDAILLDTNELQSDDVPGLIAALNNLSEAEVNAQVGIALADINLDHLLKLAVDPADVIDNSVIAQIVSKAATADWDTFDNETDSLEAIRDFFVASGVSPVAATYDNTTLLGRMLERVRQITDEPSTRAKYSDAQIIQYMQAGWESVLWEVNNVADAPIVVRHDIAISSATQTYVLPPTIGEIIQIAKINSDTDLPEWVMPIRSRHNPAGPGLTIEGNILRVQPKWGSSHTVRITFIPSGAVEICDGTSGTVLNTDFAADYVVLAASPTTGQLDLRPNAYAGCILRAISADWTGNVILTQERIIPEYDAPTRKCTVTPDFDPAPLTGTGIKYEVVPMLYRFLEMAVSYYAANMILGIEGDVDRLKACQFEFSKIIRALRLRSTQMENQVGDRFEHDTRSNRSYGAWGWGWGVG